MRGSQKICAVIQCGASGQRAQGTGRAGPISVQALGRAVMGFVRLPDVSGMLKHNHTAPTAAKLPYIQKVARRPMTCGEGVRWGL